MVWVVNGDGVSEPMGHQVEYIIDLPPKRARDWLSALPGWWTETESQQEPAYGEFEWDGRTLLANLGLVACQVRVPQIKYSWLIEGDAPSVAWVTRFEGWLLESQPGVRVVRLDELLRLEWEAQADRSWDEIPNPIDTLWRWLPSHEYGPLHYQLLPEENVQAESSLGNR